MNWLTPVLEFIGSLLVKLAGPALAFFAGKEHEQKKEAENEARVEKKQLDIAAGPDDSPSDVVDWLRGVDK